MTKPIVSVLITAYNREDYIAQAVESVLASTLQNYELIIVDDQSNDNTVKIAQSYAAKDERIKVYRNEVNLGDYPNRNKAAYYATGKYIKYLDSDDLIYPHGLEVMVRAMEQFPEAGYGLSSVPDNKGAFPVCISPKAAYLEHFFTVSAHFNRSPGSAIIRTEVFRKVGGFSGKRMIGDNEMWFKLSQEYNLVKFQRDLVWHRSHENQESQSDYSKQYDRLRNAVIEEALNADLCPLSNDEIVLVYKQLKKSAFKQKLVKTVIKIKNLLQ
jgi:glycosyltransferase involved in cell wall biosynthesis